ncbi:C-GCAxxG-C-C family protein [Parabacteroides chinchillae]|uniref:C_GCAxxG_C_C family probable redox protein n=1 Tax=Parabacteroides chinchillae TaxID=871327 RepID=A0A8G2BUI5_9BACT|nr:C-GCAxxG-C-C family protein [Parabacteroides chinchillae]SEF55579.1 C_GCAxxG_C_C family probable redox protein [Parabacteroides chinchillae]
MKDFDIEERVKQAVENFNSGYNCSQSVFLAYADVFELTLDMAKMMSGSFGGGMGRMREVCGTVSAMSMLAGFKYPVLDTSDQAARTKNYAMVQKMAELFKEKHQTIICRQLLPAAAAESNSPTPSLRTSEYYSKRPCGKFVEDAARIAGRMLKGELE